MSAQRGEQGAAWLGDAVSGVGVHRRVAGPAIDRRAAWALLLLLLLRMQPGRVPSDTECSRPQGGCSASAPSPPPPVFDDFRASFEPFTSLLPSLPRFRAMVLRRSGCGGEAGGRGRLLLEV